MTEEAFEILDALHERLWREIDGEPEPEPPEESIATSRVLREAAGIPPVDETHPLP